jgi:glycine cleavage system H protein
MNPKWPPAVAYQRALFQTELPANHRYDARHFWVSSRGQGIWRVGLTRFAVRLLGELVDYGFDARADQPISPGDEVGWIEGFKSTFGIPSLGEGRFTVGNPDLEEHLVLTSRDCYGAGWLYEFNGSVASACMGVHDYCRVLDETIDRMGGGASAC